MRDLPIGRGGTNGGAGRGSDAGTCSDAVGGVREGPGVPRGVGEFKEEDKMVRPATLSAPF